MRKGTYTVVTKNSPCLKKAYYYYKRDDYIGPAHRVLSLAWIIKNSDKVTSLRIGKDGSFVAYLPSLVFYAEFAAYTMALTFAQRRCFKHVTDTNIAKEVV